MCISKNTIQNCLILCKHKKIASGSPSLRGDTAPPSGSPRLRGDTALTQGAPVIFRKSWNLLGLSPLPVAPTQVSAPSSRPAGGSSKGPTPDI